MSLEAVEDSRATEGMTDWAIVTLSIDTSETLIGNCTVAVSKELKVVGDA